MILLRLSSFDIAGVARIRDVVTKGLNSGEPSYNFCSMPVVRSSALDPKPRPTGLVVKALVPRKVHESSYQT